MAVPGGLRLHRPARRPIKGRDGKQYVAILAGVGGWPGAIAAAELDPRVRNGAIGFAGATQDLPAYTAGGSTLLVFALPSNAQNAGNQLQPTGAKPVQSGQQADEQGGGTNPDALAPATAGVSEPQKGENPVPRTMPQPANPQVKSNDASPG